MELEHLKQKLVAAARANPPSDRVPYGFERRVMAHLASAGVADGWMLWSRALWRAAIPCVLIVIFSGLWSARHSKTETGDLSQQIENAVLSDLNHNLASVW
jgi:hypothetical protein